ncbi:MAG: hypothetical protein HQ500_12980 [Flavobacteriales bacterium]|nr:hypothetical protein [Flavobacteriales bacterium]
MRMYALMIAFFFFRTIYGLTEKFWDTDEIQCYLIGVKAFSSEFWPAWGPDSMYKVQSRIPGGLMATLIAFPLNLLLIPEAPILFLNLLTFSVLLFLIWVLEKRMPGLPKWFIRTYVLTMPWVLHFSTHVINTSYVLVGAILFFIPFLDRVGMYEKPLIGRSLAYGLMGFSLTWMFQIHMSWVLIGPFGLWLFILDLEDWKRFRKDVVFFLIGASIPILTLIPTFEWMLDSPFGGTESNIVFNPSNILLAPQFIWRFFSMGTFEIARYSSHIELLLGQVEHQYFLLPLAALLVFISAFHSLYSIGTLIALKGRWGVKLRKVVLISMAIIFSSYLFSVKPPISYTFYFAFPLVLTITLHLLEVKWKNWKLGYGFAWILFLGALFHTAHMFYGEKNKSLYTDRERVSYGLSKGEHLVLGSRRVAFFEEPDDYCQTTGSRSDELSIGCDFEYYNHRSLPQSLSSQKVKSGRYSNVITDISRFGNQLEVNSKIREGDMPVSVSFDFLSDYPDTIYWVLENKDKSLWKGAQILLHSDGNEWAQHQMTSTIPKEFLTNGCSLYLWKNSQKMNVIYVDNLWVTELTNTEHSKGQ